MSPYVEYKQEQVFVAGLNIPLLTHDFTVAMLESKYK